MKISMILDRGNNSLRICLVSCVSISSLDVHGSCSLYSVSLVLDVYSACFAALLIVVVAHKKRIVEISSSFPLVFPLQALAELANADPILKDVRYRKTQHLQQKNDWSCLLCRDTCQDTFFISLVA